ncbi:MAG: hypothetical protein CMI63_08190 [Parvularcula sp.]|nr:hypothetical protein [Parvularcula sp.]
MKPFFFALIALSMLATPIRAETAAEQNAATSDDYDYDRRVQNLYAWLLLTDFKDDPEYDQITLFYDWFMDATIGVTIINRPGLTDREGVSVQNAYLEASVQSRSNEDYGDDGELRHDRYVTDIYRIKISDQDFSSVVEDLEKRAFWSEPVDEPFDIGPDEDGYITICEGPYFVIDAGVAERAHSISRGGCGEDVAAELDHATTLLNLAREKVPQIAERLNRAERNLRRD